MPNTNNKIQLHFSVKGTGAAGQSIDKDLVAQLKKLRDISVQSEAKIHKLERQLDKLRSKAHSTGSALHKTTGHVAGLGNSLALAGAATGAIGGPMNMVTGRLHSLSMGVMAFNPLVMFAATALAAIGAAMLSTVKNAMSLQKNMILLDTATGDAQGSFALLTGQASKMGVSLEGLIAPYAKLAAAAKGTSLAGKQTVDLFKAITTASAALNLSVDQTQGVFRAFEQMISKGNVQAEELRGQLGERLPGAFSMASRAMGVTTQELNKMLKAGDVLATELIPKIAKVMQDELGAGAARGATTLQSALNRVNNSWLVLSGSILTSDSLGVLSDSVNGVAAAMEGLGVFIDSLSLAFAAGIDTSATASGLETFQHKVESFGWDLAVLADSISNSVDGIVLSLELAIPAILFQKGKVVVAAATLLGVITDVNARLNSLADPGKNSKYLNAYKKQLIKIRKLQAEANNPQGNGTQSSLSPTQEKEIERLTKHARKIKDLAEKLALTARAKEQKVFDQKEIDLTHSFKRIYDIQKTLGEDANALAKKQAEQNLQEVWDALALLDAAHTRAIKVFDDKDAKQAKRARLAKQHGFDSQIAMLNRFYAQQDAAAEGNATTALGREDIRFNKQSATLQSKLDKLAELEQTAVGDNHSKVESMILAHGDRVEALDADHATRRKVILDKMAATNASIIGDAALAAASLQSNETDAEMLKLDATLSAIGLRKQALIDGGMSELDAQKVIDDLRVVAGQETADRLAAIEKTSDDKKLAAIAAQNQAIGDAQAQFAALFNKNQQVDLGAMGDGLKAFYDESQGFAKADAKGKLDIASKGFGMLAGMMEGHSKRAFKIGKIAAVAQATVDGITAVMKASTSAPFPFNIPMMVGMAALAASNVQKILATKYGGGGAKASTSGGGASSSGGMRIVSRQPTSFNPRFVQSVRPYTTGQAGAQLQIVQHINAPGATAGTAAQIQQAAALGAQQAVAHVANDFATNGQLRQTLAV